MSPGEFLANRRGGGPDAGDSGRRSCAKACQQLRQWLDAGLPPTTVTVNLTSMEFWHPGLIQRVEDLLREYRLDPQLIEIELTEGMLMRNIDHASHVLNRLKGLGVRIAMDDFGTGYSSLARLKSFPLDVVKIDRSFVRDIHHDASDAAIARAIIAMAETLGFAVVAEGGGEHRANGVPRPTRLSRDAGLSDQPAGPGGGSGGHAAAGLASAGEDRPA